MAAAAHLGIPHHQRLGPALARLARFIAPLGRRFEAPAASEEIGGAARLLRAQGGIQHWQDPLHPGPGKILRLYGRHRLAEIGDVGRAVEGEVRRPVQAVHLAVRPFERPLAKARQPQPFGHRDKKGLHADRISLGGLGDTGLHDGPAAGGDLGHHPVPGSGPTPGLVGEGIRHYVVRQRRRLVDEAVDVDNKGQHGRVLKLLAYGLAEPGLAVEGVAHVVDPGLEPVGIAVHRRGQVFAEQRARDREPGLLRRIGILARLALAPIFGGLLVGELGSRQEDPGRLDHAGEARQIVARPRPEGIELAATRHGAAPGVEVADHDVEHHDGPGRVEAVGAHGAAVGDHRRPGAVAGELPRQLLDVGHRHGALGTVLLEGVLPARLGQQLEAALDRQLPARGRNAARHPESGPLATAGRCRLVTPLFDHQHGIPLAIGLALKGQPQIAGVQHLAEAGVRLVADHQMAGVAKAAIASPLGRFCVRCRQEGLGVTLVVDDPAQHGHGQGRVRGGPDGQPAVGGGGRQVHRVRQAGGHHHVGERLVLPRPPRRQLAGLAFEGVAGLLGGGAHEQQEVALVPVRLEVGVLLQIVQQGAGPDPERQAAVSAVVGEVAGAEAVEGKALDEVIPPLVRGVAHQQLVGPGAVLRVGRVQRLGEVANGPQPLNLALAKQIAPLHHLGHQLLEGDALPATAATGPQPLETTGDPLRAVELLQHGIAPGAGGGSPVQPPFLVATGGEQRLLDRGLEVDVMAGGEGMIGVAQDPHYLVALVVDAGPHSAQGPAAEAHGVGNSLGRVGVQLSLLVNPVLHGQRVTMDRIPGRFARAAGGNATRHLLEGVAVTGDEQPGAAGNGGALEKLAFAVIHQSASRAKGVDALMAGETKGRTSSERATSRASSRPKVPRMPSTPAGPQAIS
ncbi:hypothetical protein D3C75_507810 [compost metagenome]